MSAAPSLLGSVEALHTRYDAALLDLDGVVYRGSHAVVHAAEAVSRAAGEGMRPCYVTNNSSREPEVIAEQIRGYGLPCRAVDVVTSAQAAALLLTDLVPTGGKVLVVGGHGLRTALRGAGFELCDGAEDEPLAVVQGFAPDVGWRQLAEAAYAIAAGALHLATNLDTSIPDDRGVAPGNGALVGAVVHATGVEPHASGKPTAPIFHQATERIGARAPLVVGDRLDTDLQGARAAGIPGLLVLTGVSSARDAVLARPEQRPSFLAPDLRWLARSHPSPEQRSDGAWCCGDAVVRLGDDTVTLAQPDTVRDLTAPPADTRQAGARQRDTWRLGTDEWRALCAAAWHHVDRGGRLPHLADLAVDAER